MDGEVSLEEKILEYWFTLEFLGQDKYPHHELIGASNGVKSLKAKLLKGQRGYKSTYNFFELSTQDKLYEAVREEAKQCGMKKWGNITVYIGKVKRESCIKCIASKLPFMNEKNERPERSLDDIACVSLQLTPEGKYIEHSLSLSTIVWAMKQIKNCKGRIADCLEESKYKSAITEMEDKFFSEKNSHTTLAKNNDFNNENNIKEKEYLGTDSDQRIQEFNPNAVNISAFEKIYKYIEKEYLNSNVEQIDGKSPYQLIIGISLQIFVDENTKNLEEDDNYLGLSHDFFSNDLKMILNKVRRGDKNIPGHILNYISSTYESTNHLEGKKRIDLIQPPDKKVFEQQVQEIFNVRNAPLGKWPSKYMPAFMQQMAINLAIRKGNSPLFGVNGPVFSVNGPPGTGKTTLLKEIVVNNIIERAILLAKYDNPEDAFITHSFMHGSKQNNAYSQYTQHWYSLKDDKINDYSILVTSCNNTAVENISKELPLGSEILKNLNPADDDSDEMKKDLNEINELFDFSKSLDVESYERNSVEYPDIYFTYYAQKLLNNKNAWGLVAASLGKKKNIRDFFRYVLFPLRWDFYARKDSAANRLPKYIDAREKFLTQKKIVCEMQEQIAHICDLAYKKSKQKRKTEQLEEDYRCHLLERKSRETEITRSIEKIRSEIAAKLQEKNGILNQRNILGNQRTMLISKQQEGEKIVNSFHQEAFQIINSVGKRPLLFGKSAYEQKLQYAQKAAADYDRQAEEQIAKNKELTFKLQTVFNEYNKVSAKLEAIERSLDGLNMKLNKMNTESTELEKEIFGKQRCLKESKETLEKVTTEYEVLLKNITNKKVLDSEFVSALLSKDNDISTEAQVMNPWFSKRYNRERERLFYYAMKMNKEFILASKKCRDNFTSLGQYWGLQQGDEKERIIFHEEDRKAFAHGLYQTLFLLVPVISTTFASVGTFLRDVRNSKVIGTLVVDEAGQAQPQMAVGALFRSRKAIIVGDPKQVEPVVTDDLKLLKKAFDDEKLKPYIYSKSISVQSCADEMNAFGTYLDNPEHPDFPDWVGCPLLVHRRCISPMYEISNTISYNGIMKQKTGQPNAEQEGIFVYKKSQWIQVKGREKGNKNHFVTNQANKVCEMLEVAFSKNEFPSLYIISPFTTVISGVRSFIRKYKKGHPESSLAKSQKIDDWISKNIGTVHTFQGKEANEVIFLLGCDGSKEADGAVQWVNSNIVNVAVTRAKFRLYIIGDAAVWNSNNNLRMAKNIIDTFAIKEIHSILTDTKMNSVSKAKALNRAAKGLPPVTAFDVEENQREDGDTDYSVDTESFVEGLETHDFMKLPFTTEQLSKFGFSSQKDLLKLKPKIRKNLELGIRLFYFLKPVYIVNKDFDASCCAILFCKAIELQMKECFIEGLQNAFPDTKINGKGRKQVKLKDAYENMFTLGTFNYIIKNNISALEQYMKMRNESKYDSKWWNEFNKKLYECTNKRNKCCHDSLFEWKDLSQLLADLFMVSGSSPKISGLMFESEVGRRLKKQ